MVWYTRMDRLTNWRWTGIKLRQSEMSGSDKVWHHPTSNTRLLVESGIKVHSRQKLISESFCLSFFFFSTSFWCLYFQLTLAVFIPHPNEVSSQFMTHPPHAPASLKPLQQISKPFCIRSLSLMRCPLRKKEKIDPPLIVHIKSNEGV